MQHIGTAPTLSTSPWDMIKAFPLRSKARFAWSALRIVFDPERTQEIFNIAHLFVDNEREGRGGLSEYIAAVMAMPGVRELYDDGYLPPAADLDALSRLPVGTLGRAFAEHMHKNGLAVVFYPTFDVVDETTWLELRGRCTHDILHVVTGFSTTIPDELGLQAFGVAQANSPMSSGIIGGGLVHAAIFKPAILYPSLEAVQRGFTMGRAARNILAYRFEENWETPLAQVREELGIAVA